MLKNYLRIAFRHLWQHRAYSVLNITGLSIGIMACFLIFLYVHFELSYDGFHSKADRIYRLVTDVSTPSETRHTPFTSPPMAIHLKASFPQIEKTVRLSTASLLLRKGDIKFQEDHSLFADSTLFEVFDFPLVRGDPHTVLQAPYSIVLSQTAARKYFGDTDPIGQSILLTGGGFNSKITGVMKDIPENSQIRADVIISMPTTSMFGDTTMDLHWGDVYYTSYLLLKPHTDPKMLESRFPAFLESQAGEEMRKNNRHFTMFIEPLRDVYLKSQRVGRGAQETGNISNVYIFSVIAVFVLLIACINFVNLTTARSAERAKEVGIRKVIGAERSEITRQFLGESMLVALISFVLSVLLCALLLPLFNQLSGKVISTGIFNHPGYIGILLMIAIGIGLLAGMYPALVLSSFKPIIVLKGRFTASTRGLILRKGLVIVQFTISIALILATFIVYTQLHYMRNQDLGFQNDQMLVVDTHWDPQRFAFRQQITAAPGVLSTSLCSGIPGGDDVNAYVQAETKMGDMQQTMIDEYFVDFDFISQYKIELIAGRAFSREFITDSTKAMMLNESAVKQFGYSSPRDIIGKRFSQDGKEGQIIGVFKDFHFRSLREAIRPLGLCIDPPNWRLVSVKVSPANLPATLAAIEDKWKTIVPNRPFDYYFADEFFDRQYRSEVRFGRLFLNFAILTIIISCLGLLGLASYSTLQRTKEIGVRKVMGATVANIISLLSKEFLQLVLIAFLIASPLVWYFMHRWLQSFAYRVTISWWIFALSGSMVILITLATISIQTLKAAVANPVKSLRAE